MSKKKTAAKNPPARDLPEVLDVAANPVDAIEFKETPASGFIEGGQDKLSVFLAPGIKAYGLGESIQAGVTVCFDPARHGFQVQIQNVKLKNLVALFNK